jgi:hypothetical protein
VHPGQFPVQHHDVVRGADEVVEGVLPVEGDVHRHALLAQPAGHRCGQLRVVLDQQHPHHSSGSPRYVTVMQRT